MAPVFSLQLSLPYADKAEVLSFCGTPHRDQAEPATARDSFVKAASAAIEGRGLLERGSWASCDGARAGAHALGVLELLPDHLG